MLNNSIYIVIILILLLTTSGINFGNSGCLLLMLLVGFFCMSDSNCPCSANS